MQNKYCRKKMLNKKEVKFQQKLKSLKQVWEKDMYTIKFYKKLYNCKVCKQ